MILSQSCNIKRPTATRNTCEVLVWGRMQSLKQSSWSGRSMHLFPIKFLIFSLLPWLCTQQTDATKILDKGPHKGWSDVSILAMLRNTSDLKVTQLPHWHHCGASTEASTYIAARFRALKNEAIIIQLSQRCCLVCEFCSSYNKNQRPAFLKHPETIPASVFVDKKESLLPLVCEYSK